MDRTCIAIGASLMVTCWATAAPAAIRDCRTIVDSAARLACYDQAAGQTSAAPPAPTMRARAAPVETRGNTNPAAVAPVAQSAPSPGPNAPDVANLKARADFDTRIAAVIPLRHGYYRLQFEDGSAYNTTQEGARPQPGEAVHIRRTFLGTTYMDRDGLSPVAIKLSRQQ